MTAITAANFIDIPAAVYAAPIAVVLRLLALVHVVLGIIRVAVVRRPRNE
jgi:hypothetical protein